MSYALHMLIAIDFSFNTGNLALKYHNKINSKQGKLGGRGGVFISGVGRWDCNWMEFFVYRYIGL